MREGFNYMCVSGFIKTNIVSVERDRIEALLYIARGAQNVRDASFEMSYRALSSLRGLRGTPEVPPLCRETSVSRTPNVGTVGMNGLVRCRGSGGCSGVRGLKS